MKAGGKQALVSRLAYSSTLKMKMTCSFERMVDFHWITQRFSPEDKTLYDTTVRISNPTQCDLIQKKNISTITVITSSCRII
jgi:hypothetical protein